MPKKKKRIWLYIVILLVVLGLVGFIAKGRQQKPTNVQSDKVEQKTLISRITASGKIQPKKKVDISASIPGKVITLAVEEGQHVKKGDFLLQIDPAPYQASVANANAALSAARQDLESSRVSLKQIEQTYQRRVKEKQTGLISDQDYEQAKTDYDVQQSRVKSAQHQVEQLSANVDRAMDDLNKTRVTSPMTGIVVRKAVEEGEVAVIGTMNNPGTVLLTVADLSVMQAELEVDETDVGVVSVGQSATVTVDAFPNKQFEGTVTEIGNSPILKTDATNQEATDFKVVITLTHPDSYLRPGLTADGDITTGTCDKCITVPIQALVIRDITKGDKKKEDLPKEQREKEGVFLIKANKAVFQPVSTGIMGEMDIQVKDGVKQGEEIVSGSYQTLRELKDGDTIHVMTDKEMQIQKVIEEKQRS